MSIAEKLTQIAENEQKVYDAGYALGSSLGDKKTIKGLIDRSITDIEIPDSVTSIGGYAFRDCSSLTSITIPGSVTSIGVYAFQYCSSLTSITIPDSVTSIGSYAFNYCSSLTNATIGNGVTRIESGAFQYCSSLASIIIGSGVTSISWGAFQYCSAEFDFSRCISVPSLESTDCFTSSNNLKIIVPSSLYNEWRNATNWSFYAQYIVAAK